MNWLETLTLLGMLSGLLLMAETFRSEPMWPRMRSSPPGASPRQRRWAGAGIALVTAGQLVQLRLEGDTPWWAASFALIGLGVVCALAGVLRTPTAQERRRRARMLGSPEPEDE